MNEQYSVNLAASMIQARNADIIYVAIKAAIIGMTKTWARELGPKGIKVNAIAPGFTHNIILAFFVKPH